MRSSTLRIYAMTLDRATRLVDDVPDERMAEIPFEGAKNPAWVLTHLCVASGLLLDCLSGTPGELGGVPGAWGEVSMPGSECRPDRSIYPSKDDLLATLRRLHSEVADRFGALSDDDLAADFPIEEYRSFFPTNADAAVYMMAHHEGYHLGQLTQWRRASGLGAAAD